MTNSIDINDNQYKLLNRYIGQGRPTQNVVFFGNEPGMSGLGILDTLNFLETQPNYPVGEGFLLHESYAKPTTSDFARFCARLCLGLKYQDMRWFDDLTNLGKVTLNEYISASIKDKKTTLVNLRPLPRPTQDNWVYSNIEVKDYNRKWNFLLKRHYSDPEKDMRMLVLKNFFDQRTGLVIGSGERKNKKKFFEIIYPGIELHEADLNTHSIYFSIENKIILTDYFNNRNGIKIEGLKDLYEFITSRNLVDCTD